MPQTGDENHPGRWVKPGHQTKIKAKVPKTQSTKKKKGAGTKIQAKNVPAKK